MSNITLALQPGATNNLQNQVRQGTCVAAESQLIIQISLTGNLNGNARKVMLTCDQAWFYRSTTADPTTQMPIAAGQSLVLKFNTNQTVYFLRQTVDGTMYVIPLE